MRSQQAIELLARLRREGAEFGVEIHPLQSGGPYRIAIAGFDGICILDRRRLTVHFREIVVELLAEQYRSVGLSPRNARRVASQQDTLLRMGFTVPELESRRYLCGRVEVVPKIALAKGQQ
ncbi:MAG: hypothetical protein JSS51_04385 [Planctomycetes bacterium]|nr:hypothetical protein [Planctomycetota bacterium]